MKKLLSVLLTCLTVYLLISYVLEPGFSKISSSPPVHHHDGEPCDSQDDTRSSHHCSCVPCKVPHAQPLYAISGPSLLIYTPIPLRWFQPDHFQMISHLTSPTVPPPRDLV